MAKRKSQPYIKFNKTDLSAIDRAMMFVSIINPVAAVPQAMEIYLNKSAVNVSWVTWLCFTLVGVVLTLYSIAHRIKPMIINQILWFIVDVAILVGIIIYG
jgi:hypothetical protein